MTTSRTSAFRDGTDAVRVPPVGVRRSPEPFAPPGRFEDAVLAITVIPGPAEPSIGERITVHVRMRYVGF